jgi:rhodanese-related sulfurtransferase
MTVRPLNSALGLLLIVACLGVRQSSAQESIGEFVDGEFVEGYTYVPDFMPPDELRREIRAHATDIVIVDTAAPAIWDEEHIVGAINYPWVHELQLPVPLPRDKTLIIYCACKDHEDSIDMAKKLSQVGYLKVKVLQGGWFKWVDLGYETEGEAVEEK